MDRRRFLGRAAAGAAAASALAAFRPFRPVFAGEARRHDAAGDGFTGLARSYDLASDITYLNHASLGTVPRAVRLAREKYQRVCESNPWLYILGDAWKEAVEETRGKAARLLHCAADELAITRNTTEGFNTLAGGLELAAGDEVLFSSLNHVGASACWFHQAKRRGFKVRRFAFPILETPGLTAADVVDLHVRQISDSTRVLVLPHIDNMVGLRHPAKEIAARARQRGVRFIAVDGAQSVGMLPVDLADLDVDFYATSAHKWIQAPKGLGLLYARRGVQDKLAPVSVTWGQKLWKGSARIYEDFGTRDLDTVLALGDALDFQRGLGAQRKQAHHRMLWEHARERVEAAPYLTWRSPTAWSLSASLYAIGIKPPPAELFERMFHRHGFVFRAFHTQGLNSMRLSPNALNTRQELDRFFDTLARELA